MTRLGLLSTLLATPILGAVGLKSRSLEDKATVILGPGVYKVGPNGSIRLGENGRVTIEGVTFEA